MQQLEKMLDDLLVKKAPFQIPESGRQGIVKVMPWVTLIGGVLMLLAAWGLYQAVAVVNNLAVWADSINAAYGLGYSSPMGMNFLLWVALALLVVEAVLFFIAYPALQARQKKGWNILFWVTLLNLAQAVIQLIGYGNPGSLVMSLLGTLIGLYILFQIRPLYTGVAPAKPGASTTMNVPKETPPSAPANPPANPPAEGGDKQE